MKSTFASINNLRSIIFKSRKDKIFKDDVLIASFPKSGNTWTRFVLAHLLSSAEGQLTFKKVDKYIPELGVHDQYLYRLKRPRLIKTHKIYDKKFKKSIYIIRDPRDVYVSYFYYLSKKLPLGTTFTEFLRMEAYHPKRWAEHVNSWKNCEQTITVKFENLLDNPVGEFERIINFLPEFSFKQELLAKSIELSSFQNMRLVELKYGRNFLSDKHKRESTNFMRKGEKGDWKNHFSNDDLDFLISQIGETMNRFDYD